VLFRNLVKFVVVGSVSVMGIDGVSSGIIPSSAVSSGVGSVIITGGIVCSGIGVSSIIGADIGVGSGVDMITIVGSSVTFTGGCGCEHPAIKIKGIMNKTSQYRIHYLLCVTNR
jgi:hypothetical protein